MAADYTRLPMRLPLSPLVPAAELSSSSSAGSSLLSSLSIPFVLAQACRQPIDAARRRRLDKPLPARPAGLSPEQITLVLELLARMDRDVAAEVRRVQFAIEEARGFVRDERAEQAAREADATARLALCREVDV